MMRDYIEDENQTILEPVELVEVLDIDDAEKIIHDPKPGDECPYCEDGYFDYDGLLNLVCVYCGYTLAGCST